MAKKAKEEKQDEAQPPQPIDRVWLIMAGLITLIASVLRFIRLDLKPLHHDEGVNGFFLTNLVRDGVYKYDPANYHGPTLYYIAYPFVRIFGLQTIPIRVSVAIFGVLTVVLVLYLKRYLGRAGSLFAALFVALSPGMVFISRYFIHEIFFVFLSLAFVVSILFFVEKRRAGVCSIIWMSLLLLICLLPSALLLASYLGGDNAGALWAMRVIFVSVEATLAYFLIRTLVDWDGGRPIYFLLASASVALFFATKETAFITLGTMALACLSVWIWRGLRDGDWFETNWVKAVAGIHAVVILVLIYFHSAVADGAKWMSETFLTGQRTTETFVFCSIVFLIVAAVAAWIIFLLDLRRQNAVSFTEAAAITWGSFTGAFPDRNYTLILAVAAAAIFAYVFVLFFTSFFTYSEGVSKAFEAYTIWTKTGSKDHTQNGTFAYLKWGMKVEGPILILSALGAAIALMKGRHRFATFTAFWAFGLFAAYTIIPYKTPWLALSFLLPMCMIAGYGVGALIEAATRKLQVAAVILALSGTSVLAYQTYEQSFVRYDDDEMPYVYAHTRRGFLELMQQVEHYADKSGKGKDATIEIVSPDYWPMTWYLNDYNHANFQAHIVDATTSEVIIAKKDEQDVAAIQKYGSHYKYVGVYPLRPGVNLILLVRNDLAEPTDRDVSKILEYKTIPGYTQ